MVPDGHSAGMTGERGELDVDDLLKIVLLLVVVWLVLEIVGEVLELTLGLFSLFRPVIGLLVAALIILWLLDRI